MATKKYNRHPMSRELVRTQNRVASSPPEYLPLDDLKVGETLHFPDTPALRAALTETFQHYRNKHNILFKATLHPDDNTVIVSRFA